MNDPAPQQDVRVVGDDLHGNSTETKTRRRHARLCRCVAFECFLKERWRLQHAACSIVRLGRAHAVFRKELRANSVRLFEACSF
jgi:hypothetical protein